MARVSTYPLGSLPGTFYVISGGAPRRIVLGTMAAQAANAVAITGGTIDGVSRVVAGGVNRAPFSAQGAVATLSSLIYEIGGGGAALGAGDALPVLQDSGITQAYGRSLIGPARWGAGSDAHCALYLAGSQRNLGASVASIEFANWGYFTNSDATAGGLQNSLARQNAVKFAWVMRDLGAEFTQQLQLRARNASGSQLTSLCIQSSGLIGVQTDAPTEALDIAANTVRLRTARTPASATAAGSQGSICWDASYLYICTAANTWRRVAHSSW